MGSRFGGLKQVQPVGPHGELIIEYSAFDALRAGEAKGLGFGRLVLVIRKDIEADFRASIGRRLESRMDVHYVFQDLATLPSGFAAPSGRSKPWGTGHAVLAAQPAVRGPFAVINADDFYGAAGYRKLATHFRSTAIGAKPAYAMVGYPLKQTLSEHGAVSRGLCATDARGRLRSITEITKIEKQDDGARYTDDASRVHRLTGAEIVSMNFWGFTPAVFAQLERLFHEFLAQSGSDPKAEFYLPTTLSALNERGEAEIALLPSEDAWFGLTYREDLAAARDAIGALTAAGEYPAPLWGA
ncbi:MAG: nucleotidyltransferase [Opitutae bacterium]|nr:nucleotidyltransferase [Opitutae bacterium]